MGVFKVKALSFIAFLRTGLIAGLIFGIPIMLAAQESNQAKLNAKWDQGITFSAADKPISFSLGGRIHADWAFSSLSSKLEERVDNKGAFATQLTRFRFYQSGQIGPNFSYKLQVDFEGGSASLKDVYLRFQQIPIVGNVRVGHQKEFFSIESMTSSNNTVFMDRSLGDGFMPRRNTGVTLFNSHLQERLTWGAGLYIPTDEAGSPQNRDVDNYNLSGRVNGTPYRKDEAHQLIVSGAFSYRSRNQERFEGAPEASITDAYLAPQVIPNINRNTVMNYTASLIQGPINIQGAYRTARPDHQESDIRMNAYYGQVSYFLTGEHRNYNGASGDFKSVTPKKNFNLEKEKGWGAIEVAFRYSNLNLNNHLTQGGRMDGYTTGINWHLNPNARIMVNYLVNDLRDGGYGRILQTRFQVAF